MKMVNRLSTSTLYTVYCCIFTILEIKMNNYKKDKWSINKTLHANNVLLLK